MSASPAIAVVPEGNLLVNPGAEDGPASTGFETVPPTGWTTTSNFTAIAYGTGGGPVPADSAALGGGAHYFAGGDANPLSTASQTIDVSAAAPEIDADTVGATVSALLGGFETQGDHGTITATYLDAGGVARGSTVAGPVTAADRGGVTGLQPRGATGAVPRGTRSIVVTLTATREAGAYNDGYLDNASLTLGPRPPSPAGTGIGSTTEPPPPPVAGQSVVVRELRGAVTVRLPAAASNASFQERPGPLAGASQAGFVPLSGAANIPIRSLVNTTRGTLRLGAAQDRASTVVREVDVTSGIFQILQQARAARPPAELRLTGGSFRRCRRSKDARAAGSRRSVRRLRVNGRGRFRTRGRFSSATVRGTDWTTTDRCDGTLTTVRTGSVTVRDLVRNRTIRVAAGRRYLAAARR